MHNEIVMGIDNGGTVTKAALYTRDGKVLASASRATPVLTPAPQMTERDTGELWQANVTVIREVLRRSGTDAAHIKGIAITGHGNGLYLTDEAGRPVRRGIISTDSRAADIVRRWQRDADFACRIWPKTLQSVWPGQPVALLAWLKQHEPQTLAAARHIFMVKDLVRFWLTGEAWLELTDLSGTGLLNVRDGRPDEALLALWGLADLAGKLPPVKQSTDCCGHITASAAALTGLVAGTPVAGGMFDIAACSVASGINHSDSLAVVTGTWSINQYVAEQPVRDRTLFMNSVYPLAGKWLITDASPTSASNLEWFINGFMSAEKQQAARQGESVYALCDRQVASVTPQESQLMFLPFIFGSPALPDASAGFIGVKPYHQQAHFLRAIFEGVAFNHRWHTERLRALNPRLGRTVRIAGGVTHSAVWLQIFADVLECRLEIVDVQEHGTLGTAMAAAVMLGWYPDIFSASRQMVRVARVVEPDATNRAVWREKYQLYHTLLERMQPAWRACACPAQADRS